MIINSQKSKKEKIFWIILNLAALGAVLYFSVQLLSQYTKFQVIILRNTVIHNEMVFPAMTFCNTNYYDESLNKAQSVQPLPTSCNQSTNASNFGSRKDQVNFDKACNMFLANGNFRSCSLGLGNFSFPEYFTAQRNQGPCYTLNRYKKLKQQTIPGLKTGLHMLLYMNESDIENDVVNIEGNSILKDQRSGLVLSIHDQGIYLSDFFGEGIPIPTGYHTLITLKKYEMQRKPYPFPSECVDDGKKQHATYQGIYNVKICVTACLFTELYKKCGIGSTTKVFTGINHPVLQNLTKNEKEQCSDRIYKEFDKAKCDCPTPCHEVLYDVKVIRKPWPPAWLTKKYKNSFAQALNKTESEISGEVLRNFLKISIYFDDFTTTLVNEKEVYSYESLLSGIGGLMGLYLGASLISIIEMIWSAIKFLKMTIQLKARIARDKKNKVEAWSAKDDDSYPIH